ncbi:MAG: DUF3467 domain-containing protein [Porticoccaceae bacterium]|jgi:hypothetical protein|nr:DUF3467 domain-containing protein [Porticoccaceae bacterium]
MTEEKTKAAKAKAPAGGPTIRWDDSKMRSVYANVCNVSSTQEEVTLLFGTNQAWRSGQKEVAIELSDRVIVSPHAAKRLSRLLSSVVSEYEKRFGALADTEQVK